jgi:hypothetical protein
MALSVGTRLGQREILAPLGAEVCRPRETELWLGRWSASP